MWLEDTGYSRRKNFSRAIDKFLETEKAREQKIFNRNDFKKYKKKYKLSWHECSDGVTMLLLPRIIHQTFTHCGGISEYVELEKQEKEFGE